MLSKAIDIKQNPLQKLLKRKSLAYADVISDNTIFLLEFIDCKKVKFKVVYDNEKYPNYLFIVISFKEKYINEVDKAIKLANDNAKALGFKDIDEIYKDFRMFY